MNLSAKSLPGSACRIFGIVPRKFRKWLNPKPHKPRFAWNKMLEHECQAVEDAAWTPELIGKPISYNFIYGHESGKFFASLLTVYRMFKDKNMVEPRNPDTQLHHYNTSS